VCTDKVRRLKASCEELLPLLDFSTGIGRLRSHSRRGKGDSYAQMGRRRTRQCNPTVNLQNAHNSTAKGESAVPSSRCILFSASPSPSLFCRCSPAFYLFCLFCLFFFVFLFTQKRNKKPTATCTHPDWKRGAFGSTAETRIALLNNTKGEARSSAVDRIMQSA
jgi:hypothetical protein